MWVSGALLSSFLLGIYYIFQKSALRGNAVLSVLFVSTGISSMLFLPLILLSSAGIIETGNFFFVPSGTMKEHLAVMLKSCIVFSSWFCGYYAIKHLSITLVGPVKASQPVLTLLGATLILGEQLNGYQWIGVTLGVVSLFFMSRTSKSEGIDFKSNKLVWLLFLSVTFGAISGLYDKYLMQRYDRMFVQSWYLLYQTFLTGIFFLMLQKNRIFGNAKFQWRNSILFFAVFLSMADLVYFRALSQEGAMISIVSMIRRSSVLVSFLGGVFIFKESNIKSKAFDLLLILIGLVFLYFGSK
ncbi:MAG: EamA family transporter [Porphyromonadaceae bacterium]|jgi:transporter family protein|nr:EamA family transporter [Porphyromonadaceae bacterium]